jgi:hypothetical protein
MSASNTFSLLFKALREELSLAERRAEEERIAHNATKMASFQFIFSLETPYIISFVS